MIAAVLLIAAVVVGVWLLTRGSGRSSIAGRPVPAPAGVSVPAPSGAPSSGAAPRPGEIVITLSPDKLENAQIKTEVVTEQAGMPAAGAAGIRTTGTVQSNAYKEVPVFPIAGGVVRQINVELGNRVTRGQTLATIFSSELADAEAAYLKMAAEVEEHHQHHRRTTELVEIGAVSREDLEQATSMNKIGGGESRIIARAVDSARHEREASGRASQGPEVSEAAAVQWSRQLQGRCSPGRSTPAKSLCRARRCFASRIFRPCG